MVGAGQLARMTWQAAIGLGIRFRVLAGSAADSAAQVCPDTVLGDCKSLAELLSFARGCDVVTFDHEQVPGAHLAALEREALEGSAAGGGVAWVRPGSAAFRYAQDKLAMRQRLAELGIPVPRYGEVRGLADVERFAAGVGWPVVLKAVSGGYDGRGVWVCGTREEAARVLAQPVAVFAEERVAFVRELAALVARSPGGQAAAYPVVETVQRNGICHEVLAPAPGLAAARAGQAQRLALRLAAELEVSGLLAVELFETETGVLVNELAMRPHNSGHWTLGGAWTSQFEQHLRAVLGLPLGDPRACAPAVVMANVIGGADSQVYERYAHVMAADPGVKVYLYGKQVRPGRKIGHVTVSGSDPGELRERAARAACYLANGKE
jgi:5-(carboxyamino)imidazole ribonucleotide synthase